MLLALALLAVVALGAATAISFLDARRLLTHRSLPPGVTPADSGLAYDTVPLRTLDDVILEGWWIRPADGHRRRDLAVVVLAHAEDGASPGQLTGKASMLRHAAWLQRAGFLVLVFDFRSYGGSQGRRTTGGWHEQSDLEAAIRLAHERALGAPVAVLGEGMGATAALANAAMDPSIVGVVADSPGLTWISALRSGAAPWWTRFGVPGLAERFADREIGPHYRVEAMPVLGAAQRAGARPVMLIFGGREESLTLKEQAELLLAVGKGNATWAWTAPSAKRLGAYDAAPGEYQRRVSEFLEAAIKARIVGKD